MEPMNLGSPVWSSPSQSYSSNASNFGMASPMPMGQNSMGGGFAGSSGAIGTPSGGGTGFLPGFLMGEYSQQGTGRMV